MANKQEWAIISRLPTVFTMNKGDSLGFAFDNLGKTGRVLVVKRELYEERYEEYNRIEGIKR